MDTKGMESMDREASVELVKEASMRYYSGANPLFSDSEFEEIVERIRARWPDEAVLDSLGFGYEVSGDKLPHRVSTGSLPKVKEGQEIEIPQDARVTPKYDGISVVLYYENYSGVIQTALTRGGDSGYGKPVLGNLIASLIRRDLHRVDPSILAISAEVIVPLGVFQDHLSDAYELPRSAAAGLAQGKSARGKTRHLDIMPFRIHFRDGRVLAITDGSTEAEFKILIPFVYCHRYSNPCTLKSWINDLGVPTDGAVLWDAVALKFQTERVQTRVVGVRRQMSRLGKLVPVADVEPTRLYGTTVSTVTMVSEAWIKLHGIGPGAVIEITKANEIIPQFIRTIKRVEYESPTECPSCGSPLTFDGTNLTCSKNCIGEAVRIRHFVTTFASVHGYGPAALDRILKVNGVTTFHDLLEKLGTLKSDGLTAREKSYVDRVNSVFQEPLPLDHLLISLNLPGVGWSWSTRLGPHLIQWLTLGLKPSLALSAPVSEVVTANWDLILRTYKAFRWRT